MRQLLCFKQGVDLVCRLGRRGARGVVAVVRRLMKKLHKDLLTMYTLLLEARRGLQSPCGKGVLIWKLLSPLQNLFLNGVGYRA